jgi:hypothetical protein
MAKCHDLRRLDKNNRAFGTANRETAGGVPNGINPIPNPGKDQEDNGRRLDVRKQRQEAPTAPRQRKTVTRWRIDRQQFSRDIRQKRATDAMTFRELEKALGLDKAVLHRAETGESLSDDNFAVLLRWLGQPASVYLKKYPE